MRKLYYLILFAFICLLCAGCSSESKYEKAVELYSNAEFNEAQEIFKELDNFEDCETYVTKCKVMEELQGTYVRTETGKPAFTIEKFKVLDWDEGTTIELNDSCSVATFTNEKYGDSEYDITFINSVPILETEMPLVKLSFTRL